MTDKLKAGVIGVGYLGRFHAEKYAALPEVELVGVADLDPFKARNIADKLSTRAFDNYRDLLPRVQMVSVAVSTREHFAVARDCLTADCHVLVEKPITSELEQGRELIRLANERNLLLMVGHLERFNSAMQELQSRVTQPRFIESHRLAFFKERGTDVDVVLDLMIHDLDHVLSLVASPVREIRAVGVSVLTDTVDLANVRLEFASGCIANLTASRMSLKTMRRFRLFQPDTYLAVDFELGEFTCASKQPGAVGLIPGVGLEQRHFAKEDVLLKEISAFVDAVRTGKAVPVPGEDGLAALSLAHDIMAAMRKARG
ncbi:MAG: Gfo/Idh/MocA family oxidoreductase [Deltaproteobacteria bacterium]|nr:Gfo/Idh/MocA family oxidoreductase [Deltaproteobacteria bacterium]